MAIAFDDRPITIGSILLLTGTWANGDTSVDASDYLSEVLHFDVTANSATEQANPTGFVGTTCHFTESGSDGGRFIILGRR
jgi:hypothetical protein